MNRKKVSFGEILAYVFVTFVTLICLYPMLNVVAASFSSSKAVLSGAVTFYPIDFQLDAYKKVFGMGAIWDAMKVSVIVTLLGTALGLWLTISAAYALSKNRLKGRKILSGFILFTMYFGGGVIPTFIVVKNLGLYDTYAGLILPSSMSVFNFIIMRTFFREIPQELEEAALIDGAGDVAVLFKIILPISLPIIATVGLFIAVSYWNDYFSSLMYIQSSELYSLQLRLRQLIFEGGINYGAELTNDLTDSALPEVMKRATIVVSTIPILIVYPWLQKYFVKGVMLGSVKG